VNDFYTYHVGDNGILVHNVNYNEGTSKLVDNVVRKSLDGSKHSIYKKVGFFMIKVGSKAKIVSEKYRLVYMDTG